MSAPKKNQMPAVPMSTMDAIYRRRAVRDYAPQIIDKKTITALLEAAVHAPTAMHEEPWSFVVVQDKDTLKRLSESAKECIRADYKNSDSSQAEHMLDFVNKPGFNVFYNATTLIVICNKIQEASGMADCWLAAENLMLAACAKGLGTCVIGLSIAALNTQEWKDILEIPAGTTVIAPIILGVPAGETPIVSRKPPEILSWK
jgi:nitroreductase